MGIPSKAVGLLLLACGCSAPTGIDLTIRYPSRLTDLQITGADSNGAPVFPVSTHRFSDSVPGSNERREGNIVIRLADSLAGTVVDLTVDGLESSELVARDRTQVTLSVQELASARVELVVSLDCADGITQRAREECDDGNTVAGDGCNPSCIVEDGWACTLDSPSVCQNSPPMAVSDVASVLEDESVEVDVLANDTDVAGDEITLDDVGTPSNGSARVDSGKVVYTPTENFNGRDSFTYMIVDKAGNRATAAVDITVNPVNDPPTATSVTAMTEPMPVQLMLLGDDIDGDPLDFSVETQPNFGITSVNGEVLTYTPNAGFIGTDTLTFRVSDRVLSATATATIEVIVPGDWVDAAWSSRQTLTFDNSGQTENLDGFPVLLVLDPTRIDYTRTATAGRDLRFFDPASLGRPLAHHVESWNDGGSSFIWVKVPRIDGASSTDGIVMYFGNPAAPPNEARESVWQGRYSGAWHFAGDLNDATLQANDWNDFGTAGATGVIGDGRSFTETSYAERDFVEMNSALGTLSLWFATNQMFAENTFLFHGTEDDTMETHFGDQDAHLGFSTDGMVVFHSGGMDALRLESPLTYNDNLWHHAAVTWEHNGMAWLYIDGASVDSEDFMSGGLDFSTGMETRVWLSSAAPPDPGAFDGFLDEVRTATEAHSADWLRAQRKSMSDDGFVTFGPVERIR